MRKSLLILLFLNASLWAQSVIPPTVQDTLNLNLKPRCQRGDAQMYRLDLETISLDEENKPGGIKKNSINYLQLCFANSPDSGLIYEITVDSFSIGTPQAMDESSTWSRSIVDSLMGMSFRMQFNSKIPVTGNYYDPKIPPTTGFRYIEAWEFIDDFLPVKILGELLYAAGNRLKKVGDTATVVWPKPICYSIKRVINELFLDQKPFLLTLTGVTSYGGTQCATVSFKSTVSPYRMEMYSTDSTSFKAKGTSHMSGELTVSLKNGNLMHAKLYERLETTITRPDKKIVPRKVSKTTEIAPKGR
jgi:hypothetical protein